MNISKIGGYKNLIDLNDNKPVNAKDKNNFSSLLNDALKQVNQLQIDSEEYKNMLTVGEVDNLHDVTIAAEKANVSLQITMSIRNKVVEAYKEIMRIQI